MVSILSKVVNKFAHGDEVRIEDMDMDELKEERANVKAELELKRDRHQGLAEKRRTKFEEIRQTDDDLLQEEIAEEIASLEDEMSIFHNEHAQLMDALRVVDGLIAVKRKQNLMADHGVLKELEDMDTEEVVEMLRREDVQEMIQEEKWEELRDTFRGQLEPRYSGNKRVNEIVDMANEHSDKSVDHLLRMRDRDREKVE